MTAWSPKAPLVSGLGVFGCVSKAPLVSGLGVSQGPTASEWIEQQLTGASGVDRATADRGIGKTLIESPETLFSFGSTGQIAF